MDRRQAGKWLAILSGITVLALAGQMQLRSQAPREPIAAPTPVKIEWIEVTVRGHVRTPGRYRLQKGKTLRDALKHAKPRAGAVLPNIPLDEPLADGMAIFIEAPPVP
ncbi:MAG TPA: hypothetical protein PLB31_10570 [Fimbriimonadaceae bacterium]|nr:hypothetical protein [Armatimonadota bacterium]HCM73753.1 hypothetical protein [Armatimonadota bacterium]HRD31335.1 hypothetical protein [Fimbriimonadaceae bacterium]HRE93812.1 hypothetical protein [Fimbriimonadaceae bacterium]HRI74900.1 hypothetical protein [Fimbriimonadaceae bacterium]